MKTITLTFDDFPDVVEVRVSPVPVEDLLAILEDQDGLKFTRESFTRLADRFAPFVVTWNGKKTTPATLLRQDMNVLIGAVLGWAAGVRDVPIPLPVASSSTEQSAA